MQTITCDWFRSEKQCISLDFFFQAEDGIRDLYVTGVQTCALPICYRRKLHQHNWLHGLPLKTRFRRSKLYISALLPTALGFAVGILSAVLGIGGGFVLVPAMIYTLGMRSEERRVGKECRSRWSLER